MHSSLYALVIVGFVTALATLVVWGVNTLVDNRR